MKTFQKKIEKKELLKSYLRKKKELEKNKSFF